MISGVSKVVVPVDDQERAKDFWVDRLGFELRRDESYGDERWIEVSPPGPVASVRDSGSAKSALTSFTHAVEPLGSSTVACREDERPADAGLSSGERSLQI